MLLLLSCLASFLSMASLGWDTPHHDKLLEWSLRGASAHAKQTLKTEFRAEGVEEQRKTLERIRIELELNPRAPIPILYPGERVTPEQVLLAHSAGEPDGWGGAEGMDQNLRDEHDPLGERAHMGGSSGPSSQGFRHMYFGGWSWRAPLSTFQIPPRAIGQAPRRIEKIADLARRLIREGNDLWAWRLIGWATHYIQDLSQPFHSTQIVHWRMVPWMSLLKWPPSEAFSSLVQASTHSISNYHLAYEKYAYARLAVFENCMSEKKFASPGSANEPTPYELGLRVAEVSRDISPQLGKGLIEMFGVGLHDRAIDVGKGVGIPNFSVIEENDSLAKAREAVRAETCQALSWGVAGSRALVEWLSKTPPKH